jgi:O-6-methylguanine DNA methyltransferase
VTVSLTWTAALTPIGELLVVASDRGVAETAFAEEGEDVAEMVARIEDRRATPIARAGSRLRALTRELDGYFAGRRTAFSIPPDLSDMPAGFARRVLEVTASIPFGELWTYGDVAGLAGAPRAARAAGSALARCSVELFVPCHRVVHAGGSIGGYGRHEHRKRWLIHHERVVDAARERT